MMISVCSATYPFRQSAVFQPSQGVLQGSGKETINHSLLLVSSGISNGDAAMLLITAVPDPDFDIRGRGGAVSKKLFSARPPSVWSKNKGGGAGPPGSLPWIHHCYRLRARERKSIQLVWMPPSKSGRGILQNAEPNMQERRMTEV